MLLFTLIQSEPFQRFPSPFNTLGCGMGRLGECWGEGRVLGGLGCWSCNQGLGRIVGWA